MKRVLAFVDFLEGTSELVTLAGQVARGMHASLTLLHVVLPDADFVNGRPREDVSRVGIARELRRRHRELAILELELKKLGTDAVALMVRGDSPRGNPAGKILAEIDRLAPDLIVIGSRPRGRLRGLFKGGPAAAVMRRACCPVLRVPNGPARTAGPRGSWSANGRE